MCGEQPAAFARERNVIRNDVQWQEKEDLLAAPN